MPARWNIDVVPGYLSRDRGHYPVHKQHTLLANLIGGNTEGNCLILNARGVYPNATMTVTSNHFGCR
jgi:hypothetical protein